MANNVLTSQQIASIQRYIAQAFSEELDGQIKIDLNKFERQIKTILKAIKTEVVISQTSGKKYRKILNLNKRKQSLAARGYLLIFKFREYLLNETINYRYYFEDNQGHSKVTTFTENEILQYMKFNNQGIQLNPSKAKLANSELVKEYNAVIDSIFSLYTVPAVNNYMRLISGNLNGRIVRSQIMRQYENSNPGLKTKNGRYQVFTKGHIYEAIDTSISRIIQDNDNLNNQKLIDNYVFGKYLAYDNIKASQGGDNSITNTSIKSGSADLYDFYTIEAQLNSILKIIQGGLKNKEQVVEIIEKNFLHISKFENEQLMHNSANEAASKLFKDLEKNINKNIKVEI